MMAGRNSRFARWRGILGVAVRRVGAMAGSRGSRQVWLTIIGVGVPVALMLVVTGLAFGLVSETTVRSPGVDYWIVPEAGTAQSSVVSVGGPQLGGVHGVSTQLSARPDVEYATPVLLELVKVTGDGTSEFVLAVGVIPREPGDEFVGVSTAGLSPGDPFYGNGSYDGVWTGEAVVSAGAAALLGTTPGSSLGIESSNAAGNRSFTVVAVGGEGSGLGEFPVVVVHLSELQWLTGAESGDQADQLLVKTSDPDVRPVLASVYPRTLVLSRTGLAVQQVIASDLPLALGGIALVVAVGIGSLFAASTMGLTIAADSTTSAVLAAIGFSARSRAALIATQAVTVTLLGGLLGVLLGAIGIGVINVAATRVVGEIPIARFDPVLVAYGVGAGVVIGLITVPYLVVVSRRTTTMEDLQN